MTKKKWREIILGQMDALGLKNEAYDPIVDTLADILLQRDKAFAQFKKLGGKLVVEHTNKAGATNTAKNPQYVAWKELNDQALSYWRDLGLTPSAYKKMTGDGPKREARGGLAAALASLDG